MSAAAEEANGVEAPDPDPEVAAAHLECAQRFLEISSFAYRILMAIGEDVASDLGRQGLCEFGTQIFSGHHPYSFRSFHGPLFKLDGMHVAVTRDEEGGIVNLPREYYHKKFEIVRASTHPAKALGLSPDAADYFERTFFGAGGKFALHVFCFNFFLRMPFMNDLMIHHTTMEIRYKIGEIIRYQTHRFFVESGCTVHEAAAFLNMLNMTILANTGSDEPNINDEWARTIFKIIYNNMHISINTKAASMRDPKASAYDIPYGAVDDWPWQEITEFVPHDSTEKKHAAEADVDEGVDGPSAEKRARS